MVKRHQGNPPPYFGLFADLDLRSLLGRIYAFAQKEQHFDFYLLAFSAQHSL